MKMLRALFHENSKLILVTLELFWIVIFLLDRLSSGGGGGIPQFVYVNF